MISENFKLLTHVLCQHGFMHLKKKKKRCCYGGLVVTKVLAFHCRGALALCGCQDNETCSAENGTNVFLEASTDQTLARC